MSNEQGWLDSAGGQVEIPVQEERATLETVFACLQDSTRFALADNSQSVTEYLEHSLGVIQGHLGCQGIGIFGRQPAWQPIVKLGGRSLGKPDLAWLEQASQRNACGFVPDVPANGWGQIACPLNATLGGLPLEILVLSGRHIREDSLPLVSLLVHFLERIWGLLDQAFSSKQESESLLLLCRDFTELRKTKTTQELLELLAEQSTLLIECERATIFIRDDRTKQLIASPATGLQNKQFVIAEDSGIVGEVVQTGNSLIVPDVKTDFRFESQLDQQNGFQTKNILCVPLLDEKQQIIGAFECLNKVSGKFSDRDQFLLELLAQNAAISIQKLQAEQELARRQSDLHAEKFAQCQFVGQSPATKAIQSHIDRLCSNDLPVLITGEAGTGKQTVACSLHYRGDRAQKPFVVMHCADAQESALNEAVLEADQGTLFLDDVARLSLEDQAVLLHLLEQSEVISAGSDQALPVDVRVVAATSTRLTDQILEGKFQEELYYLLAVVSIDLPRLAERVDDIPVLVDHYLKIYCQAANKHLLSCSTEAIQELVQYSWPGNVRELKNTIERIALTCQSEQVSLGDVAELCRKQSEVSTNDFSLGLTEATLDFQQRFIRQAIAQKKGNMTAAARFLGLHRSNLYRKMRQLKMAEAKEEQAE